ncbi:hypothetical protein ABEF93_000805 [Exophiala dermatitidis]
MAARSRLLPEVRDHDKKDGFTSRRSKSLPFLGRLKHIRRRRVILALLAAWLLYLFFKNMPTDVPPTSQRYDRRYGRLSPGLPGQHGWGSEERHQDEVGPIPNYEGPIKFYGLSKTLRGRFYAFDHKGHVLFAVSRLESIPHILPLACSMSQNNHTHVHLAFMGRFSADWEEIRSLNGISDADCDINLHDARPDFSPQSSEKRLGVGAGASLGHIHGTLQLQAVLTGGGEYEDKWLLEALKDKTTSLGISHIALPPGGPGGLSWISSLDPMSLKHFNQVHVDIVIQARPESSASLIRLLRSIKDADYTGFASPRITVELPANPDPFLVHYLSKFQWPAHAVGSESRVVIRRRVDASFLSPEQAALRTVESFYPLSADEAHVLLLSPKVELSPGYFQFLMHSILEYRYAPKHVKLREHLVGVSLDLPAYAPDLQTKAPFDPEAVVEPLVLWQAPSSNAALYFGDRWVELHTFLSRRIHNDPGFRKRAKSTPVLSHEYPSWLQSVLEMMQTRGYYMMYPAFALRENSSPATAHQELHQTPEEYMKEDEEKQQSSNQQLPTDRLTDDNPLTAADEIDRLMQRERRVFPDSIVDALLGAMTAHQRKGGVADESNIPLILFSGNRVDWADSKTTAWRFAEDFAESVGGCARYDSTSKQNNNVESLFCTAPNEEGG